LYCLGGPASRCADIRDQSVIFSPETSAMSFEKYGCQVCPSNEKASAKYTSIGLPSPSCLCWIE